MKKATKKTQKSSALNAEQKTGKLLSAVTHLLLTLSIIFLISWYHAKTVQSTLDSWQQNSHN